jgi:rRNA maturation protein Nop10
MKIVVNNEAEAALVKKLLNVINDLDMFEEIKRKDAETGCVPILNHHECKILRDEFFCGSLSVVVDPKEQEIAVEDDMITGTCVVCGAQTSGVDPNRYDEISYTDYLRLMSPEVQGNWKCEDCHRNTCPECGEAQMLPDMDMCQECYEK